MIRNHHRDCEGDRGHDSGWWRGCDDGRCNDLGASMSLSGVSDMHASMRVDTHVCLLCALILGA